ncbi:hypothetical protein PRSY57_0006200C, partial [Plasmodium reichenowi]
KNIPIYNKSITSVDNLKSLNTRVYELSPIVNKNLKSCTMIYNDDKEENKESYEKNDKKTNTLNTLNLKELRNEQENIFNKNDIQQKEDKNKNIFKYRNDTENSMSLKKTISDCEVSKSQNTLTGEENYDSNYYISKNISKYNMDKKEYEKNNQLKMSGKDIRNISPNLDKLNDKKDFYGNDMSTQNSSENFSSFEKPMEINNSNYNLCNKYLNHEKDQKINSVHNLNDNNNNNNNNNNNTKKENNILSKDIINHNNITDICYNNNNSYKYFDEIAKEMEYAKNNNYDLKKKLQEQILIQRGLLKIKEQQQVYLELLKKNDIKQHKENIHNII